MTTMTQERKLPTDVQALIDDDKARYAPVYKGYFCNHAMHAIVALHELGASAKDVKRWYEDYSKKLMPAKEEHGPEVAEELKSDWTSRFGINFDDFPDYVAFFSGELRAMDGDVSQLLDKYFVAMIPGMWTSAFHPLITTGFGVSISDEESVVRGLAYLAVSYLDLNPLIDDIRPEYFAPKDLWSILDELQYDDRTWTSATHCRGFGSRLKALRLNEHQIDALHTQFGHLLAGLPKDKCSNEMLELLTTTTFELFSRTGHCDFFFLHAITSCHALRFILPMLSQEKSRLRAIKHFLFAILAVYIVRGRPKVLRPGKEESSEVASDFEATAKHVWPPLIEKAIHYNDEHVIKLVWAAKYNWDHETKDIDRKVSFLQCATKTLAKVDSEGKGWTF